MPREGNGEGSGEDAFSTPTFGCGCCSIGWVDEEDDEGKNFFAADSGLMEVVSDRRRSIGMVVVLSPPLLLRGFSLAVGLLVVFEGIC